MNIANKWTGFFVTLVAACGFFASAASALDYTTACRIEGGKAKGYVRLQGHDTSASFSGRVNFTQYDARGSEISSDWTIAVAVIVGQDLEYVEEVDAERNAISCAFDPSVAIGNSGGGGGSHPGRDYTTFCEIRGGKAYGAMALTGSRSSVSFSGKVYLTYYDARGSEVGKDWDIAVVVVVGHDREPVTDVNAPSRATSCALDISEAIGG